MKALKLLGILSPPLIVFSCNSDFSLITYNDLAENNNAHKIELRDTKLSEEELIMIIADCFDKAEKKVLKKLKKERLQCCECSEFYFMNSKLLKKKEVILCIESCVCLNHPTLIKSTYYLNKPLIQKLKLGKFKKETYMYFLKQVKRTLRGIEY